MRRLILLLLILIGNLYAATAHAAIYYVDAAVTDTNPASATPDSATYNPVTFSTSGGSASVYVTLADVNVGSFSPGDSILFRRGQVWREQLTIPSSGSVGNVLTFGAYGDGANPLLKRSNLWTSWWEEGLAYNAGMEVYTAGANDTFQFKSGSALGWTNTGGAGFAINKETTIVNSSLTSAKLTSGANATGRYSGNGRAELYQNVTVLPSTAYTVQASGYRPTGSDANVLFVRIKDTVNVTYLATDGSWNAASTTTSAVDWAGSSLNTWVAKTQSFTTAPGATSLEIKVYNYGNAMSAYVDDVLLKVSGDAVVVWGGAVASGNTNYWGMVGADGNLASTHSENPRVYRAGMTQGHISAPWADGLVYYRNDSVNPGPREVGVRQFGILITNKDYIVVDSLDGYGPGGSIDNTRNVSSPENGLFDIRGTSRNVTISNGTVTQASSYGVAAHGGPFELGSTTTNITLDRLTVHDVANTGIYNNATGGGVTNSVVYNTARYAAYGDSGGIGINGGNLLISGNEVYNIGATTASVDFAISCVGGANPITVTRNWLHDLPSGGIQVAAGCAGSTISGNLISNYSRSSATPSSYKFSGIRVGGGAGGSANVTIVNNTISGGTYQGATHAAISVASFPDSTGLVVKNNIIANNANQGLYVAAGTVTTGFVFDANLYYRSDLTNHWHWNGTDYSTLAALRTASGLSESLNSADPRFIGLLNYRTQAISPARRTGLAHASCVDVRGRVCWQPPDIGAYQATSGDLATTRSVRVP